MLSAILGRNFMKECYLPLGDLMDDMALINSAINFILYCFMSKQFRKSFGETVGLNKDSKFSSESRVLVLELSWPYEVVFSTRLR